MAEGYRIHYINPAMWGQIVLIPHPGNPSTGRKPKNYVLRLDASGDVIVSTTVWQRLEEVKAAGLDHGFVFTNTVSKPPTQRAGTGNADFTKRVFQQTTDGLSETEHAALKNVILPKGFKAVGKKLDK